MVQTLTALLIHIVFSTKHRAPALPVHELDRLFSYIGGISRAKGSSLLSAGGTEDHIHLFVSLGRTVALSELVMDIKKDSTKWLKQESLVADEFHWQDGYAAFTIGESQADALRAYIAKQREHHARLSFQEELRALCPGTTSSSTSGTCGASNCDPFRVGRGLREVGSWALSVGVAHGYWL